MNEDPIEFMDAEFSVRDPLLPADEKEISDALNRIPGIAEVRIAHDRVDVRYEPATIAKAEIISRIEAAGFVINEVKSAASSPVTDSNLPTES